MEVILIRHGKTAGNIEHRYQGGTDEPLCEIGISELRQKQQQGYYPQPETIVCSPKKRCVQTAQIICPDFYKPYEIESGLTETDFGDFEGKTYEELKENSDYLSWLQSNGEGAIPNGESRLEMSERSCSAFVRQVEKAQKNSCQRCMMVIHGGSIMAIMERFAQGNRSFYDFHVKNGEGFIMQITDWNPNKRYPTRSLIQREEEK